MKKSFRRTYKQTRHRELADYVAHIKKRVGQQVGLLGVYRTELLDMVTGERKVQYWHNITTTVGRTMIMNNLTDATPDNDMLINVAALGSDDTAVAEGDTVLGTEVYRNAIASRTNVANVGYATAYFNQTEVTGTFKEAGIFSDGLVGTPDSGILLSHVNINVTKTNTQKLTIDWTLTLLNVA